MEFFEILSLDRIGTLEGKKLYVKSISNAMNVLGSEEKAALIDLVRSEVRRKGDLKPRFWDSAPTRLKEVLCEFHYSCFKLCNTVIGYLIVRINKKKYLKYNERPPLQLIMSYNSIRQSS